MSLTRYGETFMYVLYYTYVCMHILSESLCQIILAGKARGIREQRFETWVESTMMNV